MTPTSKHRAKSAGEVKWRKTDWILVAPSGTFHLLKGQDHPLCMKRMPKGKIAHTSEEFDRLLDLPDGRFLLGEICQNCQAIFVGFRP